MINLLDILINCFQDGTTYDTNVLVTYQCLSNSIVLADYLSLLDERKKDVIEILREDFKSHGQYLDIKNPIATT